jgi:hypothetical protein
MIDNNNRSVPAIKDYTLTLSEKEIEKQLSLIFDPQICTECGQDHSFKNNFEKVRTSVDDFPSYLGNRISIAEPIVDTNAPKKLVIKK